VPSYRGTFLAACTPQVAGVLAEDPDLATSLDHVVESARRHFGDIDIDPEVFVEFIGRRIEDPARALSDLPAGDLYLACGCVLQNATALARFEKDLMPEIDGILSKHRVNVDREEFRQAMREHLLVAGSGETPRIAMYRGRGSLRNWVRVAALRNALNRARADNARPVMVSDEHVLEQITSLLATPELEPFRTEYAAVFKRAFEDALGGLSAGQRLALRYQLVDGYTLEQIGKLGNVSRATAARRLRGAKDDLLDATRRLLAERLTVEPSEADAVIRLVLSRVEVTLSRVL